MCIHVPPSDAGGAVTWLTFSRSYSRRGSSPETTATATELRLPRTMAAARTARHEILAAAGTLRHKLKI